MNFIETSVSGNGTGVELKGANLTVKLSDAQGGAVKDAGAAKVTVGVRPEHLEHVAGDDGVKIDAGVDVVEYLGHEELLHLRAGEDDIVAILDSGHGANVGDTLSLHAPAKRLHLFNTETGAAIRPN